MRKLAHPSLLRALDRGSYQGYPWVRFTGLSPAFSDPCCYDLAVVRVRQLKTEDDDRPSERALGLLSRRA